MKRKYKSVAFLVCIFMTVSGCASKESQDAEAVQGRAQAEDLVIEEEPESETLTFVDAHGQSYEVEIDPGIEKHTYHLDGFQKDGEQMRYENDERYDYRLGIDVSAYQGEIDWNRVREAGYEFAFIRLGYRGYGEEGRICLDEQYERNLREAQAAGLDTGVYFFAQAVNEEEAVEEAGFVLAHLDGCELQLPVVYDPESILEEESRTDDVSGEQFTRNTKAFCETVKAAGYEPMVYCNMLWEAYELDLKELTEYPIWYADYEPLPQTPYRFDVWQYSQTGQVDGIEGNVDLNIWMM